MHLTGPLQTAIIIIYVILMISKTLHSAENLNKVMSTRAITNATTLKKTTVTPKVEAKHRSTHHKLQPTIVVMKRIFMHLRAARKDIKKQTPVLQDFYAKVRTPLKGVFRYEWLPKDHLHWFEHKVRHFDKYKKAAILLPVLHESLKTFLSTFEEMLTFDAEGQHVVSAAVYKNRTKILKKIHDGLKVAYIEVDTDISKLNLTTETTVNLTRVERGNNWDPKPDHTTAMVQDWGVITAYYVFLKDWVSISRHMYEEYCKVKKNTHRCHAILNATSSSVR
ncbi:uncharacterized protein LOC135839371 isoform X2 [Planococcus citri]|uniref:uncharacterized protein LOC135839371 isoform X2 n=1 Tax=Planococcus citri TaxID=170843 RepID=UPI0031F8FF25